MKPLLLRPIQNPLIKAFVGAFLAGPVCLGTVFFAPRPAFSNGCPVVFSLERDKIESFFAHPNKVREYQGQRGYLLLAEQTNFNNMNFIYRVLSKALDPLVFQQLNWRIFNGSIKEFNILKTYVLNQAGQIKEQYQGLRGQNQLAGELYAGNQEKAFQNVRAVVQPEVFKQAGWTNHD